MVRVQYARHYHVKIGFKGLKEEILEDEQEIVEITNESNNTT